jgi:hypothetical protein
MSRPRGTAGDTLGRTRALVADLGDLALDLRASSYSPTTLAMFQHDLRRRVPSALGATISFGHDEHVLGRREIHVLERTLDPGEIAAGLRVPLNKLSRAEPGGVSILFYASAASAFDGLVQDLFVLFPLRPKHIDQSPALPSSAVVPSVASLQNLSLVDQALGVLLGRGYSLSEGRSHLQDGATQAQTSLGEAARAVLDGFPTRRSQGRTSSPSPPVATARDAASLLRMAPVRLVHSALPSPELRSA